MTGRLGIHLTAKWKDFDFEMLDVFQGFELCLSGRKSPFQWRDMGPL